MCQFQASELIKSSCLLNNITTMINKVKGEMQSPMGSEDDHSINSDKQQHQSTNLLQDMFANGFYSSKDVQSG
jgi:hypothetical protein